MKTIDVNTVMIHTKNKEDLEMIIALAKRLKAVVAPIEESSPYNPEFVAKIKESERQLKEGNATKVDVDNIWQSIL